MWCVSTVLYLAVVMNIEEHGPYFPESGTGRVKCCLVCADIMRGAVLLASVRNGLGARAAPRGNCQEDWTGPDDNFYSVPSWDILGLQG